MPGPSYWILQTVPHITETYIPDEGDRWTYLVSPDNLVRKGDIVYFWRNPDSNLFGWGKVIETPQVITEERTLGDGETAKRRRQSILVERKHGFQPRISAEMMLRDSRLKKFIPTPSDDLYALSLSTVQANYLNDFIREQNLEAPTGSATISWLAEELAPRFTIKALITCGEKTHEGQLVEGIRLPWFELLKVIERDPEEIYRIDPRKFEELIAGAYERDGWDEVILTPRSGDKGRDVIAIKHGLGSIRIFDQVKRNSLTNTVSADEVRSLAGAISMAPNVSKGVFTTTSTFAPKLLDDEDIARWVPHRLELRPRNILLPWLKSLGAP